MTADLSALLAAATPGPWFNDHGKVGRTASGRGIGEMDHTDDGELAARAPVLAQACLDAEKALAKWKSVSPYHRGECLFLTVGADGCTCGLQDARNMTRAVLAVLRAATGNSE